MSTGKLRAHRWILHLGNTVCSLHEPRIRVNHFVGCMTDGQLCLIWLDDSTALTIHCYHPLFCCGAIPISRSRDCRKASIEASRQRRYRLGSDRLGEEEGTVPGGLPFGGP